MTNKKKKKKQKKSNRRYIGHCYGWKFGKVERYRKVLIYNCVCIHINDK